MRNGAGAGISAAAYGSGPGEAGTGLVWFGLVSFRGLELGETLIC